MSEAEDEIRAVIEGRIAAMQAKDAQAAVDCLTNDVITFELAPPLAHPPGAARDAEAFAAWLSGYETLEIEGRDMKIEAGDDIGFAHALHHLTGTRPDGRRVSLWMRSTLCFRREADGWRIAHAHTSVPFYMDGSFRAAVDLKP